MIAVVPGSFDPVTLGHIEIIRRAAALFADVHAVVMVNPDKQCLFSPEERVELLRASVRDLAVTVGFWGGMLWEYCQKVGAAAIVKGVRDARDMQYEMDMACANRALYPGADTVLLCAAAGCERISSSEVKRRAAAGEDVCGLVTPLVRAALERAVRDG